MRKLCVLLVMFLMMFSFPIIAQNETTGEGGGETPPEPEPEPILEPEPAPEPEEPVTDEPVTEPEEPVTDEPIPEEPVTDEPIPEEPVTDEPIPEEPVTDEPVPEEPSEVELVCCETWPVIPEPVYSYDLKPKNECPPLMDGMPPVGQGFAIVENSFCEKEEPVARPPIEVPPGCEVIILENGMEIVVCEKKECPVIPEEAVSSCRENGGNVVRRIDSQGCAFIECEYAPAPPALIRQRECASPESLSEMKERCIEAGMEPISVRQGQCEVIKCTGKGEIERRCKDVEDAEVPEEKERCKNKGGRIVKHFDEKGCPFTVCIPAEEEEFECERDVPSEAHENCEIEGGNLVIKRDNEGCIRFIECTRRGNTDIEYEEIEEVPPVAKLLSIALKLETLKIEFDKLARKVRAIANYYEGIGNTAEADKFRRVAGIFSSAKDKIEEIKARLREKVGFITPDDLRDLKYDLKYISEVVMQDALFIILGGEIKLEGGTGETEEGYTNCGSDRCWKEALRLCEPVVFSPTNPAGLTATIHGLDGEICLLEASYQDMDMFCRVEDYATLNSDGPDILQYCEGDLVEWLRTNAPPSNVGTERVSPREFINKIETLGTVELIDFETLPDGTELQSGDRLTGDEWESLGVIFEFPSEEYLQVFGAKEGYHPQDRLGLSPGLGPFEAMNIPTGNLNMDSHDDLNIIFTEPVKAAGFYILDSDTDEPSESVTFFDRDGNEIEKMPLLNFVNATHEAGISKIEILEDTKDGDDVAYDNLYFVR